MSELFHAFDIRIKSEELTPVVEARLASAEARYFASLGAKSILLSRDARLSGARIMEQAADLFASFGFKVILVSHPISTCFFYYLAMVHSEGAGIMIGASHNPGCYTGQKLVGPGCTPIAMNENGTGGLDIIARNFREGTNYQPHDGGHITFIDSLSDYLDFSISFLSLSKDQIPRSGYIVDFLSGSLSEEVAMAVERLGSAPKYLRFIPDGSFPTGSPNPIIDANIAITREALIKEKAAFALCFDGDGDRMNVLDRDGREIPPSYIFAFILPRLLKALGCEKETVTVCLDPKTSPVVHQQIAKAGVKTFLVPNGHSKIKNVLRKYRNDGFVAAVEESGHYYLNMPWKGDYCSMENSLVICLAFLASYKEDKEGLAQARNLMESYIRLKEWGFVFKDDEQRKEALEKIRQCFIGKGFVAEEQMQDGTPLESTILKHSLPLCSQMGGPLASNWIQIAQRASESEPHLGRWEILARRMEDGIAAQTEIDKILSSYEGSSYIG